MSDAEIYKFMKYLHENYEMPMQVQDTDWSAVFAIFCDWRAKQ